MRETKTFQSNECRWDCCPSLAEERGSIAIQREHGRVVRWRVDVVRWHHFVESSVETRTGFLRSTARVACDVDPDVADIFAHPVLILGESEEVDVVVSCEGVDVPA